MRWRDQRLTSPRVCFIQHPVHVRHVLVRIPGTASLDRPAKTSWHTDPHRRASELAQSVYGMNKKANWRRVLRHFNYAGRAVAVVLPLITVLVLQAPPPQNSLQLFILLADVPCWWPPPVCPVCSANMAAVMISMGCGSVLMIAILGRYIHSRRKLLSFDARPVATTGSSNSQSSMSLTRCSTAKRRRRSIYDRWLMTRFTIAFVLLA